MMLSMGSVLKDQQVTNLLATDKYIAEWQNAGNEFDIISFDLTEAFDRVQHDLLLQRLYEISFHHTTVQWFQSFLAGMMQYVPHGTAHSSTISVSLSVIAGSVLGSVLFAIVINPLATELEVPLIMFADDFKVLLNITRLRKVNA
jgi:hypothetical protein